MSKAADQFVMKCKHLFQTADKDGNGLSIQELRVLVCELCKNTKTSDRMIADMFADMDDDGDKKLSWEEFSEVCKRSPKSVEASELRALFEKYDADKSGRLSADEIKNAFAELGIQSDPEESLKAVDADGDGKVSVEEFLDHWSGC